MSAFAPTDLIREVKIRPGIYNKDAILPPRKEKKHQLWLEVAESLTPIEEWATYTDMDKELRIGEVSNKWKNIRDIYYREVKLLENGETGKKRKYIYFDEMEFVRPYVGYKRPPLKKRMKMSMDSVKSSQEYDDDGSDIDMDEFIKSKKVPAVRNNPKVRKSNKPSPSTRMSTRSQKADIIDNFNVLEKSGTAKSPTFKIREGDLSFCLSLVPTLRKISDVRKLGAKIDILRVLQKNMAQIEYNEQESTVRRERSNYHRDSCNIEKGEEVGNVKADPLNDSSNSKTWW